MTGVDSNDDIMDVEVVGLIKLELFPFPIAGNCRMVDSENRVRSNSPIPRCVLCLNGVMGFSPLPGRNDCASWSFLASRAVALNMGVMSAFSMSCLSSILVGSDINECGAQLCSPRGLFSIMLGISLAYLFRI